MTQPAPDDEPKPTSSLLYMLPPLPRCSGWAYSSLLHPPVSAFPVTPDRSACTLVVSRLARRSLALRPAHAHGHQVVTALIPEASNISSPPCLLRLLPAGAVAGWGSHTLESAAFSRCTGHPTNDISRAFSKRRHNDQTSSNPTSRGVQLTRDRGGTGISLERRTCQFRSQARRRSSREHISSGP